MVPALDECQPQIVQALQNAGWMVSPKPKRFIVGRRVVYIDLVAVRDGRQIYVEVKCFTDSVSSHEQYAAVGQYLTYRAMLQALQDPTPLYLTIPGKMYETGMDPILQSVLEDNQIQLLVVDMEMERILQWTE